jgi:hypothetical protein
LLPELAPEAEADADWRHRMKRGGMKGRHEGPAPRARPRTVLAVAAAAAALLLGARGSDDDSDEGLLDAQGPLAGCAALAEMRISSISIALPSGGALDAWVTTGTAPDVMIGTNRNSATAGRSRPLCLDPSWPRYNGTADVNAALSYICTTS